MLGGRKFPLGLYLILENEWKRTQSAAVLDVGIILLIDARLESSSTNCPTAFDFSAHVYYLASV